MTKLNFTFCFSFRTKTVLGHRKIKAQNNVSYILGTDSALALFLVREWLCYVSHWFPDTQSSTFPSSTEIFLTELMNIYKYD